VLTSLSCVILVLVSWVKMHGLMEIILVFLPRACSVICVRYTDTVLEVVRRLC
jgi:hypothetical protein